MTALAVNGSDGLDGQRPGALHTRAVVHGRHADAFPGAIGLGRRRFSSSPARMHLQKSKPGTDIPRSWISRISSSSLGPDFRPKSLRRPTAVAFRTHDESRVQPPAPDSRQPTAASQPAIHSHVHFSRRCANARRVLNRDSQSSALGEPLDAGSFPAPVETAHSSARTLTRGIAFTAADDLHGKN